MVKYLRTLVQLIFVEFSGLTPTGHLVDLANTMRTRMKSMTMADLIRKPILLSLLFFLFLSFIPRENIQYLVSDIFLLFRIPLGLAAPEFPDLNGSDANLITSHCKG